jgi:hypothetical protein
MCVIQWVAVLIAQPNPMRALDNSKETTSLIYAAAAFVLFVMIIVSISLLTRWSKQKRHIGAIKCKRCGHVGPPKGVFRIGGIIPVCAKCGGDDWGAAT